MKKGALADMYKTVLGTHPRSTAERSQCPMVAQWPDSQGREPTHGARRLP